MIPALTTYVAGVAIGLLAVFALVADWQAGEVMSWLSLNLGASMWVFIGCAVLYLLTVLGLQQQLETDAAYEQVVTLDQLSEVLAHVFVGIGVIWTAIGMRNALVSTLSVPEGLANDAGQVLTRLVDGGILLALSTTIIGAIGGYLMRIGKTIYLGAALTVFYQSHERRDALETLERLGSIEQLLARQGGSFREGDHAT